MRVRRGSGAVARLRSVRPVSALGLAVPVALVFAGVAVPLVYLVVRAGEADPAVLADLLWRPRTARLAANTLGLALGTVALSTLLAAPLAWVAARADVPWRRAVTFVGVLPLAIPGYVMAYALLGAAGERGLVAEATGLVIPRPAGFWGALVTLSLASFPYLFLNLRAALSGLDPAPEEAARSLGLGPAAVLRRVVVPQLRPAWLAGALLVALHALGDFGVVSLVRFETFSQAIYLQYSASYDRVYAAALALILLALTAGLLALEARVLGAARFERGSAARTVPRVSLGAWTVPVLVGVVLVALVAVGLPLATMGFWLGRGADAGAVDWSGVAEALVNSVSAAAPAAILAAALAVPIAVVGVRRPGGISAGASRAVERAAYLGYATPPLALALALVVFTVRAAPWAYQTLGLLVAAYALHFLAEAIGPVRSALHQAPAAAEWAARSLGRSPVRAFWEVTLPQIRSGLGASVAFVFLGALKELPLTILLSPLGFTSLSMGVWGAAGEALYAVAAPYALVIVACAGGLVWLVIRGTADAR